LAIATPCGARLLATGLFSDEDLGVACYHSKAGAVELYLSHLGVQGACGSREAGAGAGVCPFGQG
jgi:CO dehydrogenase maturation factor